MADQTPNQLAVKPGAETSSATGGVKAFSIATRFEDERQRLAGGFTDADRAWRKQFLKDQHLSPNEPRYVPELYRSLNNPIRRFYKAPWQKLEDLLTPKVGSVAAKITRMVSSKSLAALFVIWGGYYYMKYNRNDWTKANFWQLRYRGKSVFKGDPNYPGRIGFVSADYWDQGFKNRKVFRD